LFLTYTFFSSVSRHLLAFFLVNAPATTDIYTLSLHDALPIWRTLALLGTSLASGICRILAARAVMVASAAGITMAFMGMVLMLVDRKSTRLNSSHVKISYAVFCLKKKNKKNIQT